MELRIKDVWNPWIQPVNILWLLTFYSSIPVIVAAVSHVVVMQEMAPMTTNSHVAITMAARVAYQRYVPDTSLASQRQPDEWSD